MDVQEPPAEVRPQASATAANAVIDRLEFKSVPDLVQQGEIRLVNGREPVNPTIWSALAMASASDGSTCTATLVGPRVIITAAHCVDVGDRPSEQVDISTHTRGGAVWFGDSPVEIASCQMHPAYVQKNWYGPTQPRSSEDFALCELTAPINGVLMESLDAAASPAVGEKILMTGYGCTAVWVEDNEIRSKSDHGTLRLGDAAVEAVGLGRFDFEPSGSYLRTISNGTSTSLCPGDSGGPAFRGVSMANQSAPGRRMVAVNSRIHAQPTKRGGYRYESYISGLGEAAFRDFQRRWTAANVNRKVCGIDIPAGSGNCRK